MGRSRAWGHSGCYGILLHWAPVSLAPLTGLPAPPAALQVVSYIYFTRIIVYLLESTLPYRYIWLSNAGVSTLLA